MEHFLFDSSSLVKVTERKKRGLISSIGVFHTKMVKILCGDEDLNELLIIKIRKTDHGMMDDHSQLKIRTEATDVSGDKLCL